MNWTLFLWVISIIGFLIAAFPGLKLILLPRLKVKVWFDQNTEQSSAQKAKEWLLESLKHAQHELKIVTGELSPVAYNQQKVVETIKEKIKNGVHIKIISGPIIYGDENGRNETWEIIKKNMEGGSIVLSFLDERPPVHFRISDGRHLALEQPHRQLEPARRMKFIFNSFFEVRKYEQMFDEMWAKAKPARRTRERGKVKINGKVFSLLKLIPVDQPNEF